MICGSFFIFDPFSNQCSVLAAEQVVCVIPFHSSNLIPPSFIFVDARCRASDTTYINQKGECLKPLWTSIRMSTRSLLSKQCLVLLDKSIWDNLGVDYFPSTYPFSLTLKIEYYVGQKNYLKIFSKISIIFFYEL